MEDADNDRKMQVIFKIIESMPESVDEEFLCNLFANAVAAYGYEENAMLICLMTAKIVSEFSESTVRERFH